jgi:hypothetical protein
MIHAQKELTVDGQPAPPAYVFVTNRGFMYALDSCHWSEVSLSCGYKIDDFASCAGARGILELARARDRHIEMHWLRKALDTHSAIPNTFDDRLPEEKDDHEMPRLLIGATYLVPNERGEEIAGVLTDAAVLEPERAAYGTYRTQDGRHIICVSLLTDAELAAYKRSPDTFFGVIKEISKDLKEPLDCPDFFWASYSRTSKERLLEFMSAWPNCSALSNLDQKDLAQIYCARMAEMMWLTHIKGRAAA